MAGSLSQTAFWTRLIIKWGAIAILILTVGKFAWGIGIGIYESFFPPPPPPPTVLFGKLPPINFSEKKPVEAPIELKLELPEGDLPKTPGALPVYVINKSSAFLGALDDARKISNLLRFTRDEEALSPSIYRFRAERTEATLEMNIITHAFSISSNLWEDQELLALLAPETPTAAAAVRSFLSTASLFPSDFTEGRTKTTLIKNQDGNLAVASSRSEAQFTRVDLFRKNYNEFPLVTSQLGAGNIWFIVSGTTDPARGIIAGEYHYFPIDEGQTSTYPLKTSQNAWEELREGRAALVSLPSSGGEVVIRRVYLAYYDPSEYQEFLQPVFVFEGDNGFTAYVPAVTDQYYGK